MHLNMESRRILVVDDNPAIHQDFRKILGQDVPGLNELQSTEAALFGDTDFEPEETRYELDSAFQGEQALEMVRKAVQEGRPYAMAFVDMRMPPGWDGVETTVRLWEVDPHLQIAFCTAYSDYSWKSVRTKLSKVDSFVILKKPFETVEVLQLADAFSTKRRLSVETELHLRELRESQERYHLLTNAVPAGVWTANSNGEGDYVNKQLKEYCGWSHDHMGGAAWQEHIHPDDYPATIETWRKSLASGGVFESEFRFRKANGEYHWHLSRAQPFRGPDGSILQWVGTLTDIEAQKQLEQTLRDSKSELEARVAERTNALARERDLLMALMEHAPDSIYFKDASFRYTRINKSFAHLLGLNDPAEAVGKTLQECCPHSSNVQDIVHEERMAVTGEPIVDWRMPIRSPSGKIVWISNTKVPLRDREGKFVGIVGIARDITERKLFEEELAYERELLRTLLDSSPDFIFFKDTESRFLRCSQTLAEQFGTTPEQIIGKKSSDFLESEHGEDSYNDEQRIIETGESIVGKLEQLRLKGSSELRWILTSKMPLRNAEGKIIGTFGISKDITEIKENERARQMMELQVRQGQKLEAIGQLAAGIAHEINTPTQYVADNTRFLRDSFASIFNVLNVGKELLEATQKGTVTDVLVRNVEATIHSADLDYLSEQIPAAIRETLEGVERVTKIVRAMKEFSHPGGKDKSPADLNKAIETTVTVARNEWKYVADMVLELDPALPQIPCFIGEFNQIVLNLVVNAAHAISDVVKQKPGTKGTITVSTRRDGDCVELRVSDTGTGIPESARGRIFEPFFTTKNAGKGSGQGLSIVYGSVVNKHNGTIHFETETGKGTTFIIRLPIAPSSELKSGHVGRAPAVHLNKLPQPAHS